MGFIKKLSLLIAVISGLFFAPVMVGANSIAFATPKDEVCKGVNLDGSPVCQNTDEKVTNVLKTILNIMSWIAGIISVIMIIIAGIKFATSNGDSSKAGSARNTIIYAVVGIVVVLLSQVIVRFVLTNVGS